MNKETLIQSHTNKHKHLEVSEYIPNQAQACYETKVNNPKHVRRRPKFDMVLQIKARLENGLSYFFSITKKFN